MRYATPAAAITSSEISATLPQKNTGCSRLKPSRAGAESSIAPSEVVQLVAVGLQTRPQVQDAFRSLGAYVVGAGPVSAVWRRRGRAPHLQAPRADRPRATNRSRARVKMARTFWRLGCIFAFLAVAAGAFGAHALRARLPADLLAVFETAARY